jgi:hypothetical protein
MAKSILNYLIIIIVSFASCKQKKVSDLQKIAQHIWKERASDNREDSVCYISVYKKTKKYINYSVGLSKLPKQIQAGLETCILKVDDKTIYFNKCEKRSNDFKSLLNKGVIKLSDSIHLDGSHEGYMYIFNTQSDGSFIRVPLPEYFIMLENKSSLHEADEDKIFDAVSDYFWSSKKY